jgi:microcin C transport system ATP-binding protein
MENILKIAHLSIAIENKIVVKNISFALKAAETLAIIGESGCGKSIIAKAILRLNNEKYFTYPQGQIFFKNHNILKEQQKSYSLNAIQQADHNLRNILGKNISLIMQDPFLSLNPVQDVKKQIAEKLIKHQLVAKDSVQHIVNKTLKEVGLEDLIQIKKTYPHQLSGGQKQRIMIAIALTTKPDIIIADEPTTALDPQTQQEILDLLSKLKGKYRLSLIFISHNLQLVKKIADKILVLSQGKAIEYNDSEEILKNPQHPYTKKLINATKLSFPDNKVNNQKIVEIKNIYASYVKGGFFNHKKNNIIENISLTIYQGETVGLIGKSGCGKSSLARILLKLQNCDQGKIIFKGTNITNLNKKNLRLLRKDMQIIFQDPFATLNPKMTIYQILKEGLLAHKIHNYKKIIKNIIKEVGLSIEYLPRFPHQFSGGQRQRIAIARAISLSPKFIILDEPTASLDVKAQKEILQLLFNLQKQHHISYLFISHDYEIIKAISNRAFILNNKILTPVDFSQTA